MRGQSVLLRPPSVEVGGTYGTKVDHNEVVAFSKAVAFFKNMISK